MSDLYRAPETRDETLTAELVLVVPVIIDYEAALDMLIKRDHHRASGVTMQGLMAAVDAAVGEEEQ